MRAGQPAGLGHVCQVTPRAHDVVARRADFAQKFFDLPAAAFALFVQRNTDFTIWCGERFGGQTRIFTLNIEIADLLEIEELLIEISRENNLTLIMSIHNIELAKEFFPRLIGLKNGRVQFDGSSVNQAELDDLYQLSEEQLTQ